VLHKNDDSLTVKGGTIENKSAQIFAIKASCIDVLVLNALN
jgi:hypothetical protein